MAIGKKKHKGASNGQEVLNAAKTMHANIRFQSIEHPIKSIMFTSTVPNEGKTTTSVLLAQAIASSAQTVLIVECDMRRRSMAATLNAHANHGLYSVLAGEVSLSQAVVATRFPRVYFLDAEPGIPNPVDLLSLKRMAELVNKLEETYDYVIFDTPPVGTFVDAAVLSTIVDGVIIVVRPDTAKRADLRNAYEQLVAANANIIGICESFAESTGSEYYYAYYTKGGKRVRRKKSKKSQSGSHSGSSFPTHDFAAQSQAQAQVSSAAARKQG